MRSNEKNHLGRYAAVAAGAAALLPLTWARPAQAAEEAGQPPVTREAPPEGPDQDNRDDQGPRRGPQAGRPDRGPRAGGRQFGGRPRMDDRDEQDGPGRPGAGQFGGGCPRGEQDELRGPRRGREQFQGGRPGDREEFAAGPRRGGRPGGEEFGDRPEGPGRGGRHEFGDRGHGRPGGPEDFARRDGGDERGPGERGRFADAGPFGETPRDFAPQAEPKAPASSEPMAVTGQVLRVEGDGSLLLRSGNETLRVSASSGRLPEGAAPGKQMRVFGVRNGNTFFATNARVLK